MNKKNLDTIFQTFEKRYPDPTTELNRETPFQLIVAVILSAQSTDKHINKVTLSLFKKVSHPQDVTTLGYEQFHAMLTSVNYHNNKAKSIFKLSQQLLELPRNEAHVQETIKDAKAIFDTYGYFIPSDRKQLRLLSGIGEKTAKVVLHVLYGLPLIAVDTHVHRISNRLGLVTTKTPEQTSKIIEQVIPKHYHEVAHHGLIFFGRRHCIARKPVCTEGEDQCPFAGFCPHFKKNIKKNL